MHDRDAKHLISKLQEEYQVLRELALQNLMCAEVQVLQLHLCHLGKTASDVLHFTSCS